MDIFLAVLINCGTFHQPKDQPQVGRVCIATVLHAIKAPHADCVADAAREAKAAEQRLITGGFVAPVTAYQCFELGDEAAKDAALAAYMRTHYRANHVKVVHHAFKDGQFNPVAGPAL